MRIVIINHFPLEGSGSGIYTKNFAEELACLGHKVLVIYPEHQKLTYKTFDSEVIVFNSGDNKDYELPFNFPCFTTHPRSSFTYYDLNEEEIQSYINAFDQRLQQVVNDFKPDVIHAQHLWIAPYVASKSNIPYIVTAHGTDLKGFKKDHRYRNFALKGAKEAAKVITISKEVDREVEELYGVEKKRRQIIMNGYDDNLFFRKDLDIQKVLITHNIKEKDFDYIVFFAGKLAHFKGVDILLQAAKLYEEKSNHRILTIIAGHGQLHDSLQLLSKELDLKKIYFLGHIKQTELVDLYNIADVSTVPSRNEPFGLVAVEALACGTPVVVTDQGGLVDFVTERVGHIVPVEDHEALSTAILEEIFAKNKSYRQDYCEEYARENFTWEKSVREAEKLYKEALQDK